MALLHVLRPGREERLFFFEKKKQKTFDSLSQTSHQSAPKDIKVFWFAQGGLRLFSKKNILSFS
jgi:hypothetical protein